MEPSAVARRVITTEAGALAALAEQLPPDFDRVVDAILNAQGRVIVSGIGKSGHVARKIAATLASTGTPAYFVHAGEASHGDLGMITAQDFCLLLSNSGETTELSDLLNYCARHDIAVAGLSSRMQSSLMRLATYRLLLPEAPEACPNGQAPTTSTTMAMALGDALAVALMEARGFKDTDFHAFHPGGKLGAQMRCVRDLMHGTDALPLVSEQTPMGEALVTMSAKGFGIVATVSETGHLNGIVSDGDLRRNLDGLLERTAGQIATKTPVTVHPETLAAKALALMNQKKISVLIVTDEDRQPVGVLHIHDCLRAGVA